MDKRLKNHSTIFSDGKGGNKKIAGIYKITNKKTNEVYIGSAKNLYVRFYRHIWDLENNEHCNEFLQKDFNKLGYNGFCFEVILVTDCMDMLKTFEQNFLDEFANNKDMCYNLRTSH